MIDWEAVLSSDSEDELKEIKLFLFRENARLENERREMMELRDKFVKERVQFRDEMDRLNHKMVIERKRLKDENLFFDKKMKCGLRNTWASSFPAHFIAVILIYI